MIRNKDDEQGHVCMGEDMVGSNSSFSRGIPYTKSRIPNLPLRFPPLSLCLPLQAPLGFDRHLSSFSATSQVFGMFFVSLTVYYFITQKVDLELCFYELILIHILLYDLHVQSSS